VQLTRVDRLRGLTGATDLAAILDEVVALRLAVEALAASLDADAQRIEALLERISDQLSDGIRVSYFPRK
jgi:hypothetical protein